MTATRQFCEFGEDQTMTSPVVASTIPSPNVTDPSGSDATQSAWNLARVAATASGVSSGTSSGASSDHSIKDSIGEGVGR